MNRFIVFEGLDGCGKDTQLFKFVEFLKDRNKYLNIWVTREPTMITDAGRCINRLLREGRLSPDDALELYVKDRVEHSKIIEKILKHSWVVCSRYDISTYVYQMVQGFSFEEIERLHRGIRVPDIVVFFKAPVEVLLSRIDDRGGREFFERRDFLEKAYKMSEFVIDKLSDERKILVVDGNKSINDVFSEMIDGLENMGVL